MATSGPTNLPAFFNADSDFRTWGAGINAALAAIGLVQTADTGQINWTTVSKPAAINTAQGYEVWRLNDSLQATVPYYFKLEYGSAGTADRPAIWITVGSSTNGAGTLAGQLGTRQQVLAASSKAAGVTLPAYFSGDGSRFSLCVNMDTTSTTFAIFVSAERTRDATGAYTADGLMMMFSSGSSSSTGFQAVPASGAVPAILTATGVPIIPVDAAASTSGGGVHSTASDVALGTIVYFIGKPFYGLAATCINRVDAGVVTSTFTATVLGGSHTFICLSTASNKYTATSESLDWLGMLWE